jgi:hypothetical protein
MQQSRRPNDETPNALGTIGTARMYQKPIEVCQEKAVATCNLRNLEVFVGDPYCDSEAIYAPAHGVKVGDANVGSSPVDGWCRSGWPQVLQLWGTCTIVPLLSDLPYLVNNNP